MRLAVAALTLLFGPFFTDFRSLPKDTRTQEENAMLEKLLAIENANMERWRRGDPMGWTEISAPEVTYVDPGLTKPVDGLEAYTDYLKQFIGKIQYDISEFIKPRVAVYGDVAVLTYNYFDAKKAPDGSLINPTHWNTTEVYARLNGKWKIIHTHWSYLQHKLPERVEVPVPVELVPAKYDGVLGELMALEAAAMERGRKGDPDGFLDLSVADVTYFDPDTPRRLDGLQALAAEYAKGRGKIHYDVMEFIAPKVQVHGDAAVLTYRFFSTRLNADGSIAQRTPWNCTEVYARINGRWKIVHTHWSFIGGQQTSGSELQD